MEKKEFTFIEKLHIDNALRNNVAKKSGWSKLKTRVEMKKSRKEIGVPYLIYDRYNFYKYSLKEQEEQFRIITEREARQKEERKARAKAKREKAISDVMEKSGWDRETAASAIKKARKTIGVSPKHYVAYRFWEVDEEAQKTYFTKGDSKALREKYNSDFKGISISTKDAFNTFFADYIGRKWAPSNCSYEEFTEKFQGEDKVIYKPVGLSGGEGIRAISLDDMKKAYDEISNLEDGIVESFIIQHPEMAKLSKNSVNTIRVVSIMTHNKKHGIETDKVHILYAGMRMGRGDGILDNLHAGGLIAGIDLDTGIIDTDGVDYDNNIYVNHPDTQTRIKGFKIPYFDEMKEMIKKAGLVCEGYFGWDVAITENGPILIEANTSPGAGILQIPYAQEKKGMRYLVEKYL